MLPSWKVKILKTRTRCLPATVAPLPACPQTAVRCIVLCPSLPGVSPITFVLTCGFWWELDGNKRILMSYWWEQEEPDENCLGTWWEQKYFDGILMGTRGIWWERSGNLMGNNPPTLQKYKKHPLGACLHHPIGSPLQNLRNILGGMLVPNDTSGWVGE